jgi:hypothetical protein
VGSNPEAADRCPVVTYHADAAAVGNPRRWALEVLVVVFLFLFFVFVLIVVVIVEVVVFEVFVVLEFVVEVVVEVLFVLEFVVFFVLGLVALLEVFVVFESYGENVAAVNDSHRHVEFRVVRECDATLSP